MKMFIVLTLLLFQTAASVFSQGIPVTGTVHDETGETLPGVNIRVQGTTMGTVTDINGKYSITVPNRDAVLEFSFVGFTTQEMVVQDRTIIAVTLSESAFAIDEVIVVGYGTQRKSDVTGAIASLSKERLDAVPASSVSQLLQGAVAGLNFSTNTASSNPDGDNIMLIRGRNSITASNNPLIILDGVPFNGSLGEIAPGDVKSLEILKDASAAAIYGSRAANGVILITTKIGEKGKTKVNYDGYYSWQKPVNFPRIMDIDEYVYYQSLRRGGGGNDYDEEDPSTWQMTDYELETYLMMKSGEYRKYTWADAILRTGSSQRHQLSVSGGGDKTRFNVSAYIQNTKGVVQRDDYKKYNLRANVTIDINEWIKFSTLNSLTFSDNSGSIPKFADAFNKSPLWRPWNPDGSINLYPAGPTDTNRINPLENMLYDDLNRKYAVSSTEYLLFDLGFVPALKGFTYKLTFNGQFTLDDKANYMPSTTKYGGNGTSEISDRIKTSLMVENLVNYQRNFDKHTVFLTGMYSWEENMDKSNKVIGTGFDNDFLSWYGANQAAQQVSSNTFLKTDLISFMFRANYTYNSRYGMIYTVRRDGASVFGVNTKWGTFMSGGVHWNLDQEDFFKNSFLGSYVNVLKIRLTYGSNGNQAIKPYQTIAPMDNSYSMASGLSNYRDAGGTIDYVDGGKPAPGFVPSGLATPGLSWETSNNLNLGFDFGLLRNRINGDFNIYRTYTHDLLLNRKISPIHGTSVIMQNIGKTQNQGLELTLNSTNISKRNFIWSTNFTFSYNECQILDLYGSHLDDDVYGDGRLKGDEANKWFIGQPIKVNYDMYINGIWQVHEAGIAAKYGAVPGYAKYDDYNNDGQYDPADRQIIGSPEPSTLLGMTNTFKYKGFNLSIFLYASLGAMKSNTFYDNSSNNAVWHDWWTPANPTNKMWSPDNSSNSYATGTGARPKKFENADFMRVKDITLGYTIPARYISRAGFSNFNVYISARNPLTFTGFTGLDPELDDGRNIPLMRETLVGLKFSF